jgi:hypothetical protein
VSGASDLDELYTQRQKLERCFAQMFDNDPRVHQVMQQYPDVNDPVVLCKLFADMMKK